MGLQIDQPPKALLRVGGKTLLEHKFDILPDEINEIVLVIGYKGEGIRRHLGDFYKNIPISYIEAKTLTGTAHALWYAKDILKGRFIVMMGDDLYDRDSTKKCTQYDFSIVCKKASPEEPGSRVLLNSEGHPIDFLTHDKYRAIKNNGGLIFTGLYSLTTDIFRYEPVKMKTKEEWGLPQTLMSIRNEHEIKVIETDFWISVNSPEELAKAQEMLTEHK